ncbi:MAG: hypothetical protein IPI54_08525 [Chitinophagaceae bacterium]|nr:hypothetical protein [Chitinophagaceae bacterium]
MISFVLKDESIEAAKQSTFTGTRLFLLAEKASVALNHRPIVLRPA